MDNVSKALGIEAICPHCHNIVTEVIEEMALGWTMLPDSVSFECPKCDEYIEFVLQWRIELVGAESVRQTDRDNLNWTEQ